MQISVQIGNNEEYIAPGEILTHEQKKKKNNNPNQNVKKLQKKYKTNIAAEKCFLVIDNMQREFAKAKEAEAKGMKRKFKKKKDKDKRKNDKYL